MTADEFLKQIETYDSLVEGKLNEREKLWELATKVTLPTDREAIQTSGVSDKVGNIAAKLIDIENELDDIIDEYIDIQRECVSVIEQLRDKPIEYKAIHKHYVLYKSYADISIEEDYSYDGIIKAKNRALSRVDEILRKKYAETENCI